MFRSLLQIYRQRRGVYAVSLGAGFGPRYFEAPCNSVVKRRKRLAPALALATRLSWTCGLLFLVASGGNAAAGFALPDSVATSSFSQQFLVLSERTPRPVPAPDLVTNKELAWLDPTLLTISSERIKEEVWQELGAGGPWRGKITLVLHHVTEPSEDAILVSERFRDSWQYKLKLPDIMDRTAYVRTMVHVLLLELANRGVPARSAEIPRWLVEGLTGQLLATSTTGIVLPAPRAGATANGIRLASTFKDARREIPLERAHKLMRGQAPLTFEQLSWPTEDPLTGAGSEFYRCNAQLFVTELQHLPQGQQCLLAMLNELPSHYNWQFAFFRAFHAYFERALDVEKWWALETVNFTGRDLAQTWPLQESLAKLGQTLHAAIETRASPSAPSLITQVSLQTIIRGWDQARQSDTLQAKLRELEQVRLRVVPLVALLIDSYRQVLSSYLQKSEKSESLFRFFSKRNLTDLASRTVEQLDSLDAKRAAMTPSATQVPGENPTQASVVAH
jgi:hypothetical protein